MQESVVSPLLESQYKKLPNRRAKLKFIIDSDAKTRIALFDTLEDRELKKIFNRMPLDEAVSMAQDMPKRRFRRVMELIDAKKAAEIQDLKKHGRRSAGALMTAEYFAFPMEMTVKEAIDAIRNNPGIEFIQGIFIVNSAGILQGYVTDRSMMIHPHSMSLRQLMRPILHKATPDTTREEVIEIVEKNKAFSLPVVNAENFLLGVITHEGIVEAKEDIADETMAYMAGTHEKFLSHEPILRRFLTRAPWLAFTLSAGLLNVGVMTSFQRYEGGILTFALFFVPLITGMSGNIGLQCSTVLIRSMALGGLSFANGKETIAKEVIGGLFTGVVFGVGCGLLVYLIDILTGGALGSTTPAAVSAIVGIGLIGGCFAGTFLGVFSPIFFARIGIDPAISAGPIVTAFNDFLSISIYFIVALGVSHLFF